MSHGASHSRRAFTLIELVLVLMLMSLLLMAAAPSMGGWNRARRLDAAAEGLLTAARWARAEAIVNAVPHRLEIDPSAGVYRVTRLDGGAWGPALGTVGRETAFPPGVSAALATSDGTTLQAIEFHPVGRATPATIRLDLESGGVALLQSAGAADPLRRVDQ